MTYQVLALKWRPQKFDDVVGQEHVTRTLQNAIRQERVPHAFLFTGSRGIGKTTTARILAKALICEQGPTPDPCGACRFCEEVREGRSLDVLEIDGASNRGIDEIRDLRENARYAPAAARSKIYIIDEVHMLTKEAFNALLKTLEEPPPHVKFIFATTEVSKVPVTIQSRCQRFDFRLLRRDEIVGQLRKIVEAEKIAISTAALTAIASAAEGSLRDSESLLDQVLAYSGRKVGEKDVYQALGIAEEKTVLEFLKDLLEQKGADCIQTLDRLAASGYDPKSFTREVLTGLRNLAVLKVSEDLSGLVTASEEGLQSLRALAASASLGKIQSLFDIFLAAERDIRGTSFPRMLLELTVLRSVRIEEVEELRGLLRRLEVLEGKAPPITSPTPSGDSSAKGSRKPAPKGSGKKKPSSKDLENKALEHEDPPPETSPPAPDASGNPDGREEIFGRLVKKLRKESVVLASFLEHGTLTKVGSKDLEIAFEENNGLFFDTLREPENLSQLRRTTCDLLGRKMEVRLVPLAGDDEKTVPKRAGESDLKKKHRREALEHPLIQGILEVFQAQVVDVKPL